MPTLPCTIHGALLRLSDLSRDAQAAYECYAILSKDRQFHIEWRQRGRQKIADIRLDYQAIQIVFDVYVKKRDRPNVLKYLRMIHHAEYGIEDDESDD